MRVFSGFCASLYLVVAACSGGTNTSANGGTAASGNGTSGSGPSGGSAGSSASGNAGVGGSGTSGSAGTLGGTAGSASGAGGNGANAGSAGVTFCVVGAKGCPCDSSGACAANLVCTVSTCCDATGDCSVPPGSGAGGANGSGGSSTGAGGSAGASACTPGVTGPVITDCGYPYASSNPLTNVAFSENEVLRAILPSGGSPLASVRLFYNDEHALTLGVRSVVVGGTSTDYDVTPLVNNPDVSHYPHTGTNALTGDQSGLDPSGRPMWPALFVTDITNDPNSRAGDWQEGGTPWNPNAIFGTWKAALRTVATTGVSITPDADPTKNNWTLGTGADPVPSSLTINQGWGAEVRWDLVLAAGHQYRIQVLVHDGDQNKSGGDVGEACVDFCAGDSCPDGSIPCSAKSDCNSISEDAQCVNGCCI